MPSKIDKMDSILQKVNRRITPDMKCVDSADDIVDEISKLLKKHKINAQCVKGGSIAKGTFLKDDYDIDLFVRFDPSYNDKDISNILEPVIAELCKKLKVKLERIHGSRDYYQFAIKKDDKELSFEIIPVILVHASNHYDANNSTDLSPEHVDWVLKHTKKNPKLTQDIRLAKQFCKSINVYGAESFINGFSGHIIDILIIHHGSFVNMLKFFSKQNAKNDSPIIIDTQKHLKNPLKELNQSKITPLIIVDPIQPYRNSAAAVSKTTLKKFIDSCKEFLDKPDEKYFIIKKFNLENEIKNSIINILKSNKLLQKKDLNTTTIKIQTLDGSKDIIGTKILKVYEKITEHLGLEDFKVLGSGWNFDYSDKSAQIFIITDKNISKYYIHQGPPSSATEDYKKFFDKYTKMKCKIEHKNGRVTVQIPREFTDSTSFIKDLCTKDFMKNRFKSIKISSGK